MFNKIIKIALYNFKQWTSDIRYLLLLFLMFAYLSHQLGSIKTMAYSTGYAVNPFVFPFIFDGLLSQLMIALGLLFLLSNAPFINEAQLFVVQRVGRRAWVLGQILYIFLATAVYLLTILVLSLIILAPVATLGTEGWGKVLTTAAYTDAGDQFAFALDISSRIIDTFAPFQALGIAFMLEFLALSVIGLLMFACNLYLPFKIGLYIGGIISFFDIAIYNVFSSDVFMQFSPMSLARMSNLDFSQGVLIGPSLTPEWSIVFNSMIIVLAMCTIIALSRFIPIGADSSD